MDRRFRELPQATQLDVARMAKEGRQHPDPAVAAAAQAWAEGVLGGGRRRLAVVALLDVGVSALLGGGGGGSIGMVVAERRFAKRLLRLGGARLDADLR